jgi:hypothetical protein
VSNYSCDPADLEPTLIRKSSHLDWSVDASIKGQVSRRLADFLDLESESSEGLEAQHRTVLAVARMLVVFCKLAIEQQKVEMKGPKAAEADCRGALLWKAEEVALGLHKDTT